MQDYCEEIVRKIETRERETGAFSQVESAAIMRGSCGNFEHFHEIIAQITLPRKGLPAHNTVS